MSIINYDVYVLRVAARDIVNYCYLIVDRSTKKAAIVDPAWRLEVITLALERLGAQLTMILLTHSHDDHVNLVNALSQLYQPAVYMTRQEIEYYNYDSPSLHSLEDYSSIRLGNTSVTCLLTPGHTAGSCCYLLSDSIFTGDTIFIEGCGICNLPGGNADAMFDSVQKIKMWVHNNVQVYPGHSFGKPPGARFSSLLEDNIYFLIYDRESFVKFRMRKIHRLLQFH